jgi:hypothetical protein
MSSNPGVLNVVSEFDVKCCSPTSTNTSLLLMMVLIEKVSAAVCNLLITVCVKHLIVSLIIVKLNQFLTVCKCLHDRRNNS